MRSFKKKFAAMMVMTAMITHEATAFCGFYVSKADGTLKNKTSQVIIVHDGNRKDLGVKIEAKYLVDEYDILLLSAKESSGLKTWLTENGYKIPDGANEVLQPYINSNMKFFVVKVNEKEKKKLPGNFLRPIQ